MPQKELGNFMRDLTFSFYNLSKPTIAAVNGVAVGAGFALLCDIRIASEKARFSSGYIRMGITPDIGSTYFLPRLVGTAKAMELMITSDTIDAAEAKQLGMLNKVVPEEELLKTATELAGRIAKGPSIAIDLTKQVIKKSAHSSLEQQIELECSAFYQCLKTVDHKEGVSAFFAKRQAAFKGR